MRTTSTVIGPDWHVRTDEVPDVAVGVVCEMSDLDEFEDEEFEDFDDEDFDDDFDDDFEEELGDEEFDDDLDDDDLDDGFGGDDETDTDKA